MGDVHGHLAKLTELLRNAGLVDEQGTWTGGTTTLILVGDMVDRGQDGVGVIDLVMRLQQAGAAVHALLGNHEAQLLAARRFGGELHSDWHRWGGLLADLERLQPRHMAWLEQLPAMLRIDDELLIHADAAIYFESGANVDEVNAAFASVMSGDDAQRYEAFQQRFVEKRAFQGARGVEFARQMLERFGGRRIIHGHSPIAVVTRQPPQSVTQALTYADGLCVNVDHGLYLGGPGFIFDSTA